jgi:hypothetical protein
MILLRVALSALIVLRLSLFARNDPLHVFGGLLPGTDRQGSNVLRHNNFHDAIFCPRTRSAVKQEVVGSLPK